MLPYFHISFKEYKATDIWKWKSYEIRTKLREILSKTAVMSGKISRVQQKVCENNPNFHFISSDNHN